ncbi:hypothetical protein DWB61_01625 [Ancylomarina euxinus]|uniref:Uncharacterized protein n=1 Tax=Ancylomarina euxinus TaxID=2283627 RepID=A0A425Y863_9BACT|nr:hypothetical protein [Ancylomarina euxinus]MCZ4693390.1 hypothetical protein [Ancylomarina euxinus]MUP13618.1 hypothetical protein [Ancylomarina euxinus]RRG24739.1 hypothetical protein DWB61_01625 [Ancylomarina euxinus]
MKKFLIILIMACTLSSQAQNAKITVLKQFLSDLINFDSIAFNEEQPIISISQMAHDNAAEIIKITRENIKLALIEAKSFKHCLIICEHHTLIRIVDNEDCNLSNLWGTCMPLSRAYIQRKGALSEKKDYLKNLIGRPDSKKRTMYLFN